MDCHRVYYWLNRPVLTAAELEKMQQGTSAVAVGASGAVVAGPGSQTPTAPAPALEIGVDADGSTFALTVPALPVLTTRADPGVAVPGGLASLQLNMADLDVGALLIRVAAANAAIQLGVVLDFAILERVGASMFANCH